MRHKGRTMFAALVAVLALGIVGVASASAALPEFVPGAGEKLPATLEGSRPSATVSINSSSQAGLIRCSGVTFKGEVTGAKTASLTTEWSNCGFSVEDTCTSVGAAKGHIVVSGTAALDYISKASKEVGLVLKLNNTEISCVAATKFVLRGSVVIPVTPINTKTSTIDALIKASGNKQEFSSYENEKGEVEKAKLELETGAGYQAVGLNIEQEIKLASSKPLTIDA